MTPRKVVLENFLSFGTPAQALEFADGEPLWVIAGPNGAGKSAVFDAITYALFGCHRGGKGQGMTDLVRHGATGFRVEFEFAVAGRDYRVVRNHGKKAVDKVYRRAADDWTEVDVGGGRNAVRAWAERELGLTYEQFTASVLLRQGEADRIVTADGRERLEMLKQIIGLGSYERLGEAVRDATKQAKAERESAARRLADVPPVSDADLAAAEVARADAEAGFAVAREAESAAAARVVQAERFAALSADLARLDARLTAAAARLADAAAIRDRHARLTALADGLPKLDALTAARAAAAAAEPEVAGLRGREAEQATAADRAAADRDAATAAAVEHRRRADAAGAAARERERESKADREALDKAVEVERIDADLAVLPADLDALLRVAADAAAAAESAHAAASAAHARADALLGQKRAELAAFGSVAVGAVCSHCRQRVTAEHAEKERTALAAAVAALATEATTAADAVSATRRTLDAARADSRTRDGQIRQRDELHSRRVGLVRHAELPAAAALRVRLGEHESELARLSDAVSAERAKADAAAARAEAAAAEHAAAAAALADTRTRLKAAEGRLLTAAERARTLAEAVPPAWQNADPVALRREHAELTAAGTADAFARLRDDETQRAGWEEERSRAAAERDALPADARVSPAAAADAARQAKRATESAAAARDAAARAADALARRAADHAARLADDHAAEAAARVHSKLDKLLGPDGLQRDLVRTAERQIVGYADDTVRRLSDGDLSVELADDGPDKAFTLRVRRADDPTPIGVAYLSGSQKFRVAVAVAVAVGRFAAAGTRARPLESVIIDEGFGSLDRDGLRCMADELARLKDGCGLRRIVLVSHQDEFAGRFPVGYRLTPTASGTTATPYSRR